jgi:hypothetical protein
MPNSLLDLQRLRNVVSEYLNSAQPKVPYYRVFSSMWFIFFSLSCTALGRRATSQWRVPSIE